MKTKIILRFFLLIITGSALIFFSGCSGDSGSKSDSSDIVYDIEGCGYGIIVIGNQVWMTENLRVGSFRDGSGMLSNVSNSDWPYIGDVPACAVYPDDLIDGLNSDSDVIKAYGLLYNWAAVSDSRGLCPDGYRVPTEDDWEELIAHIGGDDIAGGKLKSTRTYPISHPRWDSPNTGATNGYYFSALPGGFRSYLGGWFDYIGYAGEWWSSTELGSSFAGVCVIYTDGEDITQTYRDKGTGLSVRCIQE